MSYLVLVVFLIPFVWADDAANKTASLNMTTAVSVVKRQLTPRPYGKRGYANARALVKRDDACANFDPEKEKLRKAKKALAITEKILTAAGHGATAIGELKSSVPIFGRLAGAPAKVIGASLRAAGAAAGAASLAIDVETQELEYMKCFKEEFDEFKKDFNKFKTEMKEEFDKVFAKFDELDQKLDKEFNEIKDHIKELSDTMKEEFKNLTKLIQDTEDKRVMSDYQLKISSMKTLKMHFRPYTTYPVQDTRSNLFTHCATKDPLQVLNAVNDVHLGLVLHTATSKHYPLLMNRCVKILLEVVEVAQMAIACFERTLSMSDQSKTEEARLSHTELIVGIVEKIIKQMQEAMQKAKQDLINDIIPAKFPSVDWCRPRAGLVHRRDRRQKKDDDWLNLIRQCRKNAKGVYNYLREVHSWAEWTVVATHGKSTGKIEYDPPNAILGEAKNINPVDDCCSYSVIWCEKDDDNARKENAQRFKIWKDTPSVCTGDILSGMVESLQIKLSGSPSLANSPTTWKGIMAILTVEADEQYQNSNAIDFGNDSSKFGDDNLIKGQCKMAFGRRYNLYYHVCF